MSDVPASVAYQPGRWAALAAADVGLIADLDPAGAPLIACWDALRSGAGVDAVLSALAATRASFALAYRGEPGGRLFVAGTALAGVRDSGADRATAVNSNGVEPWSEVAFAADSDVRLIAATEQLPERSPALPLLGGIVLAACVVLTARSWAETARSGADAPERAGWVPPEPEALPWRTPDSYGRELSGEYPSYADAGPTIASVPITPDPPAPAPAPIPRVRAVQCASGHVNPPYPGACRVCGVPLTAQEPFTVDRPSLGTLVLSTGPAVDLDRDVLLGRAPFAVNEFGTRLVPLPSPSNDISRNHVRIALDGWSVQVIDLASTNGTIVTLPGQPPVRLRAYDPFTIVAGTSVLIADEVGVRYETARSE